MTENTPSPSPRRAFMQAAGLAVLAPAAISLTPMAQAQDKIPQATVMYQPTPKDGQQCNQCQHWQAPNGCAIVAGDIAPAGWCGVWVKKEG
jgi:High potential iron-sulfur protein